MVREHIQNLRCLTSLAKKYYSLKNDLITYKKPNN